MKLRVSYSTLSRWAQGDWNGAIQALMGIWPAPTPAMEEGIKYHRQFEAEARRTNRTPVIFGARPLREFKLEKETKKVIQVNDWLTLSGVLDVWDRPEWLEGFERGIDYKTGVTPATQHANSFQHKVYQILYPRMRVFEYRAFNQHLPEGNPDKVTVSICHLTDRTLEDGLEYVLTYASEIRAYCEQNNIVIPERG